MKEQNKQFLPAIVTIVTDTKPHNGWRIGTNEETSYVSMMQSKGWELLGPPVDDRNGKWVYYWRHTRINDGSGYLFGEDAVKLYNVLLASDADKALVANKRAGFFFMSDGRWCCFDNRNGLFDISECNSETECKAWLDKYGK